MAEEQKQHYDLLVIGGGAAGSTAATTARSNGARVALIERDKLGGTCLNYGCDPTKTLLHIAQMLYQAHHVDQYGLSIPTVTVRWEAVQEYVRRVIERIRGGSLEEARVEMKKKGIELFLGEARFVSPHEVIVKGTKGGRDEHGGTIVAAEHIIIATGSHTVVPPIEGLDKAGFITNVQAVSLPSLPRRLAVIGGGPIGIEFAQMFSRFRVEVTVIERGSMILDQEERELADLLCDKLTEEGLHLRTEAELRQVQHTAEGKLVTFRCGEGQEEQLLVDEVLMAIGRRPALEKLQLEMAGVNVSKKGIVVDATMRTSVPHIWAAGDVTGGYQFTHVASEQGRIAAHNAFAKELQRFDDRVIPWVTYTDPPLAHVGKTETQLREEGVAYRVSRLKFSEVERAITNGNTDGVVKLLVDDQKHILGGHILGERADDLLAPLVVAMHENLTTEVLASTILPYPTLSEGIRWAADRVE